MPGIWAARRRLPLHIAELSGCALCELRRAREAANPRRQGAARAMLKMFRKIAEIDEVSRGGDARGGDDVRKFTNIAGPGMLQQHGLCAAREPGDCFAISVVG